MRREFLDCYADYVLKFIQAYAEHGIRIAAITPQNECNTQQNGRMPACIWHPELEAEFIQILKAKLLRAGLDVKIWMYDHNFADVNRVLWSLESCEGLSAACSGVAFHYYEGSIEETVAVTERFPNLELHFTEGGPRLTERYDTDWCKWGLMIVKALKAGYRSFTGWNLMLDEMGGPNVGPFMGVCGGFVTRDSQSGAITYSGQYKAYAHIAPYVTPTSRIRAISMDESFHMQMAYFPKPRIMPEGVLIENEDGKKIAVLVNPNSIAMQTQIEIDGRDWYVELHADSIVTLTVE